MSLNSLKVRNALTLKPNAVPTNPEDGDMYYDNTLNCFQSYLNGQWVQLSGFAGPKNYLAPYTASTSSGVSNIGNGNAQLGNTNGWSLGTIGTLTNGLPTGSPTFGSGASGNLSLGVVSSGQIAGSYSFSYTSSAATTGGNMMASNAFYIDNEDQGKVITVKFYYSVPTGASTANFSGTSSNSFAWAIWDVTNSAWLGTAGQFGMTQNSGVGYVTGTFQTAINTTELRFVLYNANASSGAITLYLDDFFVGPQTAPSGPVITDWVAFTPTGSWTANTTYTGLWRRVGDVMELAIGITVSGTPTSTNLSFNLPSGYTINTAQLGLANNDMVGVYRAINSAGTSYNGWIFAGSSTTLNATCNETNGGSGTFPDGNNVNATQPFTWSATSYLSFSARVPIVGWSSNVQMSSDTDTRVVAMQVSQAAPTATITSSYSLIKFTGGVLQDTHGAFSTSTGLYTCPVTGFYRCSAGVNIQATFTSGEVSGISIYHNGSIYQAAGQQSVVGTEVVYPNISCTVYCLAGDTLAPYGLSNGSSTSIPSSAILNYFNVERLSGPAVIAATESVNMSYTDTSGGSIGTSPAAYSFGTKLYDSHNAYSGSTYTVPISGKYRVSTTMLTAAVSLSTAQSFSVYIYKNGSVYLSFNQLGNGASANYNSAVTGTVSCNAGDTIQIYTRAAVATTANTGAGFNNLSIERIGN